MSMEFTSVWTKRPRQPKSAGLGRDQIVAAAMEILESEGLAALTMRKLGARLGAGATSLYWYVANKDELYELVMDEFWGMLTPPEQENASWREVLTVFAYDFRGKLLAHSWAAGLVGRVPSVGPNSLRLQDRLRQACVAAGFDGIDIYLASGTVTCFVFGQVIPELGWINATGSATFDPESMIRIVDEVAADYPQMRADYRVSAGTDPNVARAMAFDFGLLCVLDGLAARLGAPEPAERPAP